MRALFEVSFFLDIFPSVLHWNSTGAPFSSQIKILSSIFEISGIENSKFRFNAKEISSNIRPQFIRNVSFLSPLPMRDVTVHKPWRNVGALSTRYNLGPSVQPPLWNNIDVDQYPQQRRYGINIEDDRGITISRSRESQREGALFPRSNSLPLSTDFDISIGMDTR